MLTVTMKVNGQSVSHDVPDNTLLVTFLRETLRLTGTHIGCDTSQCGACVIHVDGTSVKSCTMLAAQAEGADITTIEGIAVGDELHPMQQAFHENHGLQCGFCTPGIVMSLVAHHLNKAGKSRIDIDEALAGNLCRCTGYGPIIDATQKSLTLDQPKKWECLIDNAYRTLSDWQNEKLL